MMQDGSDTIQSVDDTPDEKPQPMPPPRPRRKRRWLRRIGLALAVLLVVGLILSGVTAQRLYAFGTAISTQPPLSSQINLSGPERINLLVMGFGGENTPDGHLTDSLLIISLQPQTGQTALISVPRDLWVPTPPDSSNTFGKANSVYDYGLYNGYGKEQAGAVAAGDIAARAMSIVTGLGVTYWLTLDFSGFRTLVDALGGIDLNVQHSFTACYPENDDPDIDANWTTVQFTAGSQHMNGERAIEYARARLVIGGDLAEGSDSARSARQQILIRTILSEMTQVSEWPHLWGALDALQQSIYTNLSLLDLDHLVNRLDLNHARHIVLSTQNVLMEVPLPASHPYLTIQAGDQTIATGQCPPPPGTPFLLVPRGKGWDVVHQYIQQQLGG